MANKYVVGDLAALTASFIDATGVFVDPTTVIFSIRKPNGSVVNPAVSKISTGTYQGSQFLDTPGTWVWKAVGTGTVLAASRPEQGTFIVEPQAF